MISSLLLIAVGVVLLVVGADALVSGASRIAGRFEIPPLILGLTIVAIGTSMPEITVSTTAALGGNTELALGNVVGSNIFNIALCLGLAGLVAPSGLLAPAQLLAFDLPFMLLVAFALLPLIFTDYEVSRLEGGVLLSWCAVYLIRTVLGAVASPMLETFSRVALFGLLPVTAVFLVATVVMALHGPKSSLPG